MVVVGGGSVVVEMMASAKVKGDMKTVEAAAWVRAANSGRLAGTVVRSDETMGRAGKRAAYPKTFRVHEVA